MSARKSAEDAAVSEEPEAAADDPQAAEPEQLDEARPAEAEAAVEERPAEVAPEPQSVDPFEASQEHTANAIAGRRVALRNAECAVADNQADINRLRVEIDALNSVRAAQGLSQL